MSMTDPVADMFVRIRNGLAAGKASVRMPASKVKLAIARLLKDEGYLNDVAERDIEGKKEIEIALKYYEGRPAIERLERASRPGLRRYRGKTELPKVMGGLGISIISTSSGLMTDAQARAKGLGGEVICLVA
ncbi:MAG TPA: 30S ribosomal protein S8 [Pseudomonadota bacterium]|jgi:small subunit ribosomal protein S8|nr:30S ribosomal protein S8 [Xanthomonadales bacterium]MBP7417096.1 30S ribosomal protein S8 [Xanthomonadales bacterium]HQY35298.1 30S ribosomal protein S8 [Pseudomonadota bacterium]HRA36290.1 30S ribosomal protein S8 [Pseudomonadota bacterium]